MPRINISVCERHGEEMCDHEVMGEQSVVGKYDCGIAECDGGMMDECERVMKEGVYLADVWVRHRIQ